MHCKHIPLMKDYNLKNYIELFYLIVHKRTSLKTFMKNFDLSYYQFSLDFERLCEMAPNYGIKTYIDKNVLSFKLVDEPLFQRKKEQCVSFYYKNRTRKNNKSYDNIFLVGEISTLILSQPERITVDSISEALGRSKCGLRECLRISREIIESYQISVKNIPYRGLVTVGNEFHFRLCTTYFLGFTVNENFLSLQKNRFNEYDHFDEVKMQIIQILNTNDELIINQEYIEKLVVYILVQGQRISQGKTISQLKMKQFDISLLQSLSMMKTARKIYENFFQSFNIDEAEKLNEIVSIAILILCYESYLVLTDVKLLNPFFEESAETLTYRCVTLLKENWGIVVQDQQDLEFIKMNCLKICINDEFGFLSFRGFGLYGKHLIYYENTILSYILHDLKHEMQDHFQSVVRDHWLDFFTYFLIKKILEQKIVTTKPEICVYSIEGYEKSKIIAELLLQYVNIKPLDAIQLISNLDHYNPNSIIISDRYIEGNNVFLINNIESILEIADRIQAHIMDGIEISIGNFEKRRIDLETADYESLLLTISENRLNHYCYVDCSGGRLLILNNYQSKLPQQKTSFIYGQIRSGVHYKKEKAYEYFYVSFNKNTISLKLLSEILRAIIADKKHMQDFIELNWQQFSKLYLRHLKK